jgi:hypothetical protein
MSAEPAVFEMEVGNDYGNLLVWELRGTFYWYVSSYMGTDYETDGEEISEALYRQLVLQYYKENPTEANALADEVIGKQLGTDRVDDKYSGMDSAQVFNLITAGSKV